MEEVMNKKLSLLAILSLVFTMFSCQDDHSNVAIKYHEDGRAKPSVALTSIIDSTNFEGDWSLSEEFTELLKNKMAKSQKLYIPHIHQSGSHFHFGNNPFASDISWMRDLEVNQDFVVFMELINHEKKIEANDSSVPLSNIPAEDACSKLNIALRLKIVDLRENNPKVVLQEVIKDQFEIPNTLTAQENEKAAFGTVQYRRSYTAQAHDKLLDTVADRINEYVDLAKIR